MQTLASGWWSDNESNEYYVWNDVACSEEEYINGIEDFVNSAVGDADWKQYSSDVYSNEERYANVLAAYDALRKVTYSTCVPEVVTFKLSDGILTLVTDDGSRFGWKSGEEGYSISYPVADDCIWETGWFGSEYVVEETIDYEWVKSYIEQTQIEYAEGYAKYGDSDESGVISPMGIYIEVVDGIIVRVYTAFS